MDDVLHADAATSLSYNTQYSARLIKW